MPRLGATVAKAVRVVGASAPRSLQEGNLVRLAAGTLNQISRVAMLTWALPLVHHSDSRSSQSHFRRFVTSPHSFGTRALLDSSHLTETVRHSRPFFLSPVYVPRSL
jgi:hypothetical protein